MRMTVGRSIAALVALFALIMAFIWWTYYTQRPGRFALLMTGMSVPRSGHTSTDLSGIWGGNVLIAGGHGPYGIDRSSAELFDTQTEEFVATGSMRVGRSLHKAVKYLTPAAANSRVYVFGGSSSRASAAPAKGLVEYFDPATGVFADAGTLVTPRAHSFGVDVVGPAQFLVAGGSSFNTSGPVADAEVFNFGTGTSQAVGTMTQPRSWAEVFSLPAQSMAVVLGGAATADLFQQASQSFSASTSSTAWRLAYTATRLRDGRILIAGGMGGSIPSPTNCVAVAEIFDPVSRTFTSTGTLVKSRVYHTATLLRDGRVLIAGGTDCAGEQYTGTRSAELFDPAAGTFSSTGDLVVARWTHAATLTNTGKVLITGGLRELSPLSSAEIYIPPQ